MTTKTPQVLSRRTNASASESTKSKATADGASRPGKAKGTAEKQAEARGANDADTPKAPKTRVPHEGEKVIIRRLPPGMTEAECLFILGSEWAVGEGKIDWFSYAPGKVSNELSKPSRPARAYIHVMREDYIMPLSEVVRNATWEDAKCTFNSPSLIGPPVLENSIYKKVPGTKKRVDARQGTIDQDPEFMAFLEGLANPAPPREGIENEDAEEVPETKVTTTPLIEYLKEKKANKAKESAATKSAKHSRQPETAAAKSKSASKEDEGSRKKGKDSKNPKAEKPSHKEPVKILTKKAAAAGSEKSAEVAKSAASQASTSGNAASSTTEAPTPKSRRAGVSIAARMLQRDLGLSPGSAYRRARQDAAKAEAGSKSSATDKENKEIPGATNENQSSPAQTSAETAAGAQTHVKDNVSKAQQPARKTRGGKNADKTKTSEASGGQNTNTTPPIILKKKSGASGDADASKSTADAPSNTQQNSNSKSAGGAANGSKGASAKSTGSQKKSGAAASANATRGFVKHANSSQGITEPVLKQSLETFGTVTFIEVDKRKGFAYVDFADHSGLTKAISASPIAVAQGTVQVMERKDKKPAAASSGTGNAGATASTSNTATNGAAPEKNPGTGRGRRGRSGKGAAPTNGTSVAAASGG